MAQIILTVPDAVAARVLDGIAGQFGRPETILDADGNTIPNPVSKAQFARTVLAGIVKDIVRTWEATQAAEAARREAVASVNASIEIT